MTLHSYHPLNGDLVGGQNLHIYADEPSSQVVIVSSVVLTAGIGLSYAKKQPHMTIINDEL